MVGFAIKLTAAGCSKYESSKLLNREAFGLRIEEFEKAELGNDWMELWSNFKTVNIWILHKGVKKSEKN